MVVDGFRSFLFINNTHFFNIIKHAIIPSTNNSLLKHPPYSNPINIHHPFSLQEQWYMAFQSISLMCTAKMLHTSTAEHVRPMFIEN